MTAGPACMGGWCPIRACCQSYVASDRNEPAERLCGPGQRDAYKPAGKARPIVAAAARRIGWFAADESQGAAA